MKKTLGQALEKAIKAPDVVKTTRNIRALADDKAAAEFKKAITDEYAIVKNLLKTPIPPAK